MDQDIDFVKLATDHWPFLMVAYVLMMIGVVMSKRVFTRERAYRRLPGLKGYIQQSFWWWMRETLPLHPVLVGFLIGLTWVDPEGRGWSRQASSWYFAGAGVSSMFLWLVVKATAKQRGIVIELPGDSLHPARARGEDKESH